MDRGGAARRARHCRGRECGLEHKRQGSEDSGKTETTAKKDHEGKSAGKYRGGKGKYHGKKVKRHRYGMVFKAKLSGDQEVIGKDDPDPSKVATRGHAKLLVSKDGSKVKFRKKIRDGKGVFENAGAHIHCAPAGVNGPPVVWLAGIMPPGAGLDGTVKIGGMIHDGSIVATPDPKSDGATCPALITDVASLLEAAKAGYLYVNVHSSEFPGGVVRGQLEVAPLHCVRTKGKDRKVATSGKRCYHKVVKG